MQPLQYIGSDCEDNARNSLDSESNSELDNESNSEPDSESNSRLALPIDNTGTVRNTRIHEPTSLMNP